MRTCKRGSVDSGSGLIRLIGEQILLAANIAIAPTFNIPKEIKPIFEIILALGKTSPTIIHPMGAQHPRNPRKIVDLVHVVGIFTFTRTFFVLIDKKNNEHKQYRYNII